MIHGNLVEKLRYGENPHQESAIYSKDKKIFVAENEKEANKIAVKFYKKKVELNPSLVPFLSIISIKKKDI